MGVEVGELSRTEAQTLDLPLGLSPGRYPRTPFPEILLDHRKSSPSSYNCQEAQDKGTEGRSQTPHSHFLALIHKIILSVGGTKFLKLKYRTAARTLIEACTYSRRSLCSFHNRQEVVGPELDPHPVPSFYFHLGLLIHATWNGRTLTGGR